MHLTALQWLYAGIGLILFEVMSPGFVTLFFGLAALTVALMVWLVPAMGMGWQWLIFSVLSILYIVLLRRTLKQIFSGKREVSATPDDEFTGKLAIVCEAISPQRPGRVELGSTTWSAQAGEELAVGTSVRIVGRDNLTLRVAAVKEEE